MDVVLEKPTVQCNIDQKGRSVRRNGGLLCLALGAASLGAAYSGVSRRLFLGAGVCLVLAGLFQLYESRKGWCVIRALGIKTPV